MIFHKFIDAIVGYYDASIYQLKCSLRDMCKIYSTNNDANFKSTGEVLE